jgi:hypothetical protein
MPNVYIRIHPDGSVLYSIRWVVDVARFCNLTGLCVVYVV